MNTIKLKTQIFGVHSNTDSLNFSRHAEIL